MCLRQFNARPRGVHRRCTFFLPVGNTAAAAPEVGEGAGRKGGQTGGPGAPRGVGARAPGRTVQRRGDGGDEEEGGEQKWRKRYRAAQPPQQTAARREKRPDRRIARRSGAEATGHGGGRAAAPPAPAAAGAVAAKGCFRRAGAGAAESDLARTCCEAPFCCPPFPPSVSTTAPRACVGDQVGGPGGDKNSARACGCVSAVALALAVGSEGDGRRAAVARRKRRRESKKRLLEDLKKRGLRPRRRTSRRAGRDDAWGDRDSGGCVRARKRACCADGAKEAARRGGRRRRRRARTMTRSRCSHVTADGSCRLWPAAADTALQRCVRRAERVPRSASAVRLLPAACGAEGGGGEG